MSAPTLPEFMAGAQFVRFKGQRRYWVRYKDAMYAITAQSRGMLRARPDAILQEIHRTEVVPASSFFTNLDRDLRAIGAKP